MTTRRRFVFALGAGSLIAPQLVFAQQQKRVIGYLANDPDETSPTFQAFVRRLQERGWVRGKNVEIFYETSCGRDERFGEKARKVVRQNVDIIVTTGSGSTRAAMAATKTIPIVFGSAQNPVESNFVASLPQPGGNVTGLAILVLELGPKRLQLMKEMVPHATRFARLYHDSGKGPKQVQAAIVKEDNIAASTLGVALEHIPVTLPTLDGKDGDCAALEDKDRERAFDSVFASIRRSGIEAIYVKADALFVVNRDLIAKLALKYRLPMMCADGRFADAGALLSYGENFVSRYQSAADMVSKIFQGNKPSELPVEQPMTLELVVNRATAKALGIKIPEAILVQANRVIG